MTKLPERFLKRMEERLPADEREAFFAVYEKKPVKGLRVNTLKISPERYEKISPFALKKTAWAEEAFVVDAEKVGAHPHHFAGLFYSQEPSATAVAPALKVKAGEKVLDLCSAPKNHLFYCRSKQLTLQHSLHAANRTKTATMETAAKLISYPTLAKENCPIRNGSLRS